MSTLEWAGHCAPKAEPYAMGVALGHAGVFVAARGGGGGGATLMPASLLRQVLETAVRALPSPRTALSLADLFGALDEALGDIVNEKTEGLARYRGSSAEVVAALEGEGCVWVGTVGLGRAWLVSEQALRQVTRDDSLLEDWRDAYPGSEPPESVLRHEGVVTTVLNGRWRTDRPGWRARSVTLDGAEGLLLSTFTAHHHIPASQLHRWTRDALATGDLGLGAANLWAHLREHVGTLSNHWGLWHNFDRNAAVVLVRHHTPAPP